MSYPVNRMTAGSSIRPAADVCAASERGPGGFRLGSFCLVGLTVIAAAAWSPAPASAQSGAAPAPKREHTQQVRKLGARQAQRPSRPRREETERPRELTSRAPERVGRVRQREVQRLSKSQRQEAERAAKVKRKDGERLSKEPFGNIPKGPLQIVISTDQQKLHLYSDGVHVADALVATGVPEHPTPLGVFSVIEKDRLHHSNIYSGAPMPFMQRITWSGVAIHEGVGVGHPASHGCIRVPHDFATRLWTLTKLGARVVIARPELAPSAFADPRLFVHKEKAVAPTPAPATPFVDEGIKDGVKTAETLDNSTTTDAVVPSVAAADGRSSVPTADHAGLERGGDAAQSATGQSNGKPAVKSAEADGFPGKLRMERVVDDAAGNLLDTPAKPADAAPSEQEAKEPAAAKGGDASAAAPESKPTADGGEAAKQAQRPPVAAASPLGVDPQNAPCVIPPAGGAAKLAPPLPAIVPATGEPKPPADAALESVPLPLPRPNAVAKGAVTRNEPIAVFISRKQKEIYVRRNFVPLFHAAVTIDRPEQPLGTHVFTAMEYADDGASFRWNVISLPGEPLRAAARAEKDARGKRKGEPIAKPVLDPAPPQTAHEALARIEIPQDIIDQISELIVPGSSLIISDQGLGSETGEGTDFIVVAR